MMKEKKIKREPENRRQGRSRIRKEITMHGSQAESKKTTRK